jgi:BON domain
MTSFRYHDDDSSLASMVTGLTVGALAGFAAGVVLAQKVGGISGIASRVRERFHASEEEERIGGHGYSVYDDDEEGEDPTLEERVLEAFRNDPILSERAIDIGAIGDGVIELTGWVDTEEESEHAVTIARGVPGVETVVNRLAIGAEEQIFEDNARRRESGDPALTEARWEGQRLGTGQRRQGTSDEADRHADPKPGLEDRWLDEGEALRNSAEDLPSSGERRRGGKRPSKGDRTSGGPIAPTGVPKADHVAEPERAPEEQGRAD